MIETETVMLPAQGPGVVYVTLYDPIALDARSISPVAVLTNTSPAGDELNVPPVVPVTVGVIVPVWQKLLPG